MKYLKLFESSIQLIEDTHSYTLICDEAYIKFEIMKDTHNLIEFNGDNIELSDLYEVIGEEAIYVSELYSDETDSPFLIRRMMKELEKICKKWDFDTIVGIAEPFLDKRLDRDRLVNFYTKMGFNIYADLTPTSTIVYKHL